MKSVERLCCKRGANLIVFAHESVSKPITNGCSSTSWTHAMAGPLGRRNVLLQLVHLLPRRCQRCTAGCLSQQRTPSDEFRHICLQLKGTLATWNALNLLNRSYFLGAAQSRQRRFKQIRLQMHGVMWRLRQHTQIHVAL